MSCLTPEQEIEVKEKILAAFPIDVQRVLDFQFSRLNDERISSPDNLSFLKKVYDNRQGDTLIVEMIVAALLYGMRIGELNREYVYRESQMAQQEPKKPLPKFGHAE